MPKLACFFPKNREKFAHNCSFFTKNFRKIGMFSATNLSLIFWKKHTNSPQIFVEKLKLANFWKSTRNFCEILGKKHANFSRLCEKKDKICGHFWEKNMPILANFLLPFLHHGHVSSSASYDVINSFQEIRGIIVNKMKGQFSFRKICVCKFWQFLGFGFFLQKFTKIWHVISQKCAEISRFCLQKFAKKQQVFPLLLLLVNMCQIFANFLGKPAAFSRIFGDKFL